MQWVEFMDWWGSCVGGFGGLVDLVDLVDWWIWWIWWIGGLVDPPVEETAKGSRRSKLCRPLGKHLFPISHFFPHFEEKYMYKYLAGFFVGSFSFMFFFCKLEYHLFITLLFRIWRIVTQTVICDSFFLQKWSFFISIEDSPPNWKVAFPW